MINASEQDFAFTIEHEIGHALDYAPAESSRGVDQAKMGHSDPEFLKAAKADGGRAASVTQYGKTDSEEFYAECFAMYISQPDTLAIMRPNIYKYFKTYQWGGLKDPKLNPYAPKPGDKPRMGEFGIIGPF
jgi:Mlc titration factor MtfA (ptsG expression regulator)